MEPKATSHSPNILAINRILFTLEWKSFLMGLVYVQNSVQSVEDWENIRGKFAAPLIINL